MIAAASINATVDIVRHCCGCARHYFIYILLFISFDAKPRSRRTAKERGTFIEQVLPVVWMASPVSGRSVFAASFFLKLIGSLAVLSLFTLFLGMRRVHVFSSRRAITLGRFRERGLANAERSSGDAEPDSLLPIGPGAKFSEGTHTSKSMSFAKEKTEATAEALITQYGKAPSRRRNETSLRILYFTLDTLKSWRANALNGGPKGEIVVSDALHEALRAMGHEVFSMDSDEAFFNATRANSSAYDLFFFDQITIFDSTWSPRAFLLDRPSDVFLMDFFGAADITMLVSKLKGFQLHQVLTAMGGDSPSRTYLGFYLKEPMDMSNVTKTEGFGFLWGKTERDSKPPIEILRATSSRVELRAHFSHSLDSSLLVPVGVLPQASYIDTLRRASFLLGTGNPILGPSAVEAVQYGCFLIIPQFGPPVLLNDRLPALTQHDFVVSRAPKDRYCLYSMERLETSLGECIDRAQARNETTPFVFPELTWDAYLARVQAIIDKWRRN